MIATRYTSTLARYGDNTNLLMDINCRWIQKLTTCGNQSSNIDLLMHSVLGESKRCTMITMRHTSTLARYGDTIDLLMDMNCTLWMKRPLCG